MQSYDELMFAMLLNKPLVRLNDTKVHLKRVLRDNQNARVDYDFLDRSLI